MRLLTVTNPTLPWLARAADDPRARHPTHLPETLDFSEHADVFLRVYHSAPAGTELGFPVVQQPDALLAFPPELAAQARREAYLEGGRFVGTFHVHPPDRPPFFDPQDLAVSLRSDNAGFVELLLARGRLLALVRANPYLYISGHHVTRNPLLLEEAHQRLVRRVPEDPGYEEAYRKASLYYFHRYQLALYEGDPREALRRTVTPREGW